MHRDYPHVISDCTNRARSLRTEIIPTSSRTVPTWHALLTPILSPHNVGLYKLGTLATHRDYPHVISDCTIRARSSRNEIIPPSFWTVPTGHALHAPKLPPRHFGLYQQDTLFTHRNYPYVSSDYINRARSSRNEIIPTCTNRAQQLFPPHLGLYQQGTLFTNRNYTYVISDCTNRARSSQTEIIPMSSRTVPTGHALHVPKLFHVYQQGTLITHRNYPHVTSDCTNWARSSRTEIIPT
jgi:hypothetical protein